VNIPVVCDGVTVEPGDIIVADDDGVLAVPLHRAAEAIERARRRNDAEQDIRRQIKSGKSLFEILNMQKNLDAANVEIVDGLWSDRSIGAR
jgi:4-hydroxy-4-methyl-2-oxoglutarate aldolase